MLVIILFLNYNAFVLHLHMHSSKSCWCCKIDYIGGGDYNFNGWGGQWSTNQCLLKELDALLPQLCVRRHLFIKVLEETEEAEGDQSMKMGLAFWLVMMVI